MNIVVLDGYTLNPGDLSWKELQSFGHCTIYDRTASDEVVGRAADAELALTNKTVVNREHISRLPKLRYIGVMATGYNVVDITAARERNIPVTNVPAYGTRSVAQMTFALLLELAQHVGHHSQTVHQGRWSQSPDFCYWDYPLLELEHLKIGIVGYGKIGRAVGELARAFGMQVLVPERPSNQNVESGVTAVSLDRLFSESDVISLHCPLTDETRHLVNRPRLAQMKPGAFLINTSRGPLIDEQALADALNSETIAGAGLDVLSHEPPPSNHPLLKAKNCFITPHISWATNKARARLLQMAVANVKAFLNGNPQNVVN